MQRRGLYVGEPGKGRACWLAMGYVLAEERVEYMAFHDADVRGYSREMLARLVLPTLDPTVDYDFVKGYYARVSDRLHGRVTRLLLNPLLTAFTRLIGENDYIRYLSSFRYALSGEFAVKCDLAQRMRLPCDWGLEIVTLFEALRHRAPVRLCQVELAERYDHKHQELSADDPTAGRPPHGPRRGQAPAAHPRRGRGEPARRAPAQPARRLPARGRGRRGRQLRRGHHQRPRLRPPRGGAATSRSSSPPCAPPSPGVPGRSPGRAARAQLGAGLGGHARGERAPPGRGRRPCRGRAQLPGAPWPIA